MDLAEGERLAIVGESGVGKSTLLHILGTLDRPTRGKILFGGKELPLDDEAALCQFRNRQIGFVFQFHYLLPDFSALENVMFPALIQGVEPAQRAKSDAEQLLDLVGLKDRLSHRPGKLSGGEQQRVAVARAVILKPKLVLADEPTGSLDLRIGEEVQELLFRLNEEHDIALDRRYPQPANLPKKLAAASSSERAVGGHLGMPFPGRCLTGTLNTPLQKYWYLLEN